MHKVVIVIEIVSEKLLADVFKFCRHVVEKSLKGALQFPFLQQLATSKARLDPTNSNSIISTSPLFWAQNRFPWMCSSVIY